MLKVLTALVLIIFAFLLPVNADEPISLMVNIISHSLQNGAGKEVDVAIIKEELEKLGHRVNFFDYYLVNKISSADINIFLAQFKLEWLREAKLNWFIPNAESCDATLADLQRFNLVLCKTKESLRIFKPISKETYDLGFTSIDHYQPFVTKNFSKYLHLAGKSRMKGTDKVFRTWRTHPTFPKLILIKHTEHVLRGIEQFKNIKCITKRIPLDSLLSIQNECGIHLCPSKTEGFGHYIMEAMSTGAVIITTNAPPMNEFIKDQRCLIKYTHTEKKKYATMYNIDDKELAKTVQALQKLTPQELQIIGESNREEYLRRDAEFKNKFKKLINRAVRIIYGVNQE